MFTVPPRPIESACRVISRPKFPPAIAVATTGVLHAVVDPSGFRGETSAPREMAAEAQALVR